MPDISKCTGTNCPLKEKCYRYTSQSNEYRQSYLMDIPFTIKQGMVVCDHFMNIPIPLSKEEYIEKLIELFRPIRIIK